MEAIRNYFKVLFGTKTGRTALLAIVGIAGAYFNGTLSPQEAFAGIVVALQTVNIRDAIAKAASKPATGGGSTGGGQ